MDILHAVLHHLRNGVVQVPLADDRKALELVDHGDGRKLPIFTDGWSEGFPFLVSGASPHRVMLGVVDPHAYFADLSSRCLGLQLCTVYIRPAKCALGGVPTRRKWSAGPAGHRYNREDSEHDECSQAARLVVMVESGLHG